MRGFAQPILVGVLQMQAADDGVDGQIGALPAAILQGIDDTCVTTALN